MKSTNVPLVLLENMIDNELRFSTDKLLYKNILKDEFATQRDFGECHSTDRIDVNVTFKADRTVGCLVFQFLCIIYPTATERYNPNLEKIMMQRYPNLTNPYFMWQ